MNDVILIVEDEEKIARLLEDYLNQAGYSVHVVDNGSDVLPWMRQHTPALVLLDIMLPGQDGFSVLREIRQAGAISTVPVIMLTARIEEIDRLLGLEMGADDYICKPFSPREVVARVKAVLRRGSSDNAVTTDALQLDEHRHCAVFRSDSLALTAVEFRLLQRLISEPGRIFSRNQLMDSIYDDHRIVSDRTIDSHVKKLRKKLAALGDIEWIQSVYGVGYRYEP